MQKINAKRNAFVAIAGNIGVGKTTLTRILAERFGWTVFFEKEVHNPYLADFYKDMSRWAFHSQLFFLKERLKDHLRIQVSETICVQDRTIYEDAEIFAQNLFDRGLMQERDFACYLDLYQSISQALQPPAVIVYLRASIWTLISRIRHRGRDYEQNIDKEYLAQLNIAYERWIKRAAVNHRIFVIETDEHDILKDKDWADGILAEIYRLVTAGQTV